MQIQHPTPAESAVTRDVQETGPRPKPETSIYERQVGSPASACRARRHMVVENRLRPGGVWGRGGDLGDPVCH